MKKELKGDIPLPFREGGAGGLNPLVGDPRAVSLLSF